MAPCFISQVRKQALERQTQSEVDPTAPGSRAASPGAAWCLSSFNTGETRIFIDKTGVTKNTGFPGSPQFPRLIANIH